MKTFKKIVIWVVVALVVAFGVWFGIHFYFVWGDGVRAGNLNQVVYKGWIWKTYEGRLIQTGFRGNRQGSGMQSNEFNFSVVDKAVADSLMRCSGKMVELRYKEYNGMLPWRGMQRYIVCDILSVSDAHVSSDLPIVTSGEDI